jgi:hypothetical protein
MPPTADPGIAPDVAHGVEGTVTIALDGRLDANAGVELLATLQAHLDGGATRIDIDLLGVDDWSPEGARALRRCRRLAPNLPGGLHYRTGPGAGHDALLEAFADPDDEAGDDADPVDDLPAGAEGSDPA